MLIDKGALGDRQRLAAGALSPLADSLARDLARLTQATEIYIPTTKARLTRAGGRCPQCGSTLEFDPWSPQRHRCARCSNEVTGEEHDGMWLMWYQLWLAERALHAAVLYGTRDNPAHRALAERILGTYADQYLSYPNKDNVLGPTRVFFSTYLESIWLLQLACALDVLETAVGEATLGATVRSRLIEPSAALIQQYDEGFSNRQVWNNAALLAAGGLLGNATMTQRAVMGRSGLLAHLEHALFADGTWYEGENYHLFAHRGLWYGVTLGDAAHLDIPSELRSRYIKAFETPFATALPDFTFPSRRDSQYKVSLRQWRIAESCELGLAAAPRPQLAAALRDLYRSEIARGDTGRDRSTAEAERNVPASRLTRADLGWKSLLFALEQPTLAESAATPFGSVLLPEQGFAVLRRAEGRVYVALDYGAVGGGHGHPDRLNLWLVVGDARILEDVGTGSYVDPSLHWYRSTLAHNAPLAGGQSQLRVDGALVSYDERGDFGWTLARAAIAPNVDAERAVVVAPDYVLDEVTWSGGPDTIVDLPFHVAGTAPSVRTWTDAPIPGGRDLEDGFAHIVHGARSELLRSATISGSVNGVAVTLWLNGDAPFVLWLLRGPGPPNEPPRDFFLARSTGSLGRLRTVIDWSDVVSTVEATDESLTVTRRDGSQHVHARQEDDWRITTDSARVVLKRGNVRLAPDSYTPPAPFAEPDPIQIPQLADVDEQPGALTLDGSRARVFTLGAQHYRRSEQTWEEAGRPKATIALAATADDLHVDISVLKEPVAFAPARATNPLDNEHPDTNSDGVQLYLDGWSWILVPESSAPAVRVTTRQVASGRAPTLYAGWCLTPNGYGMRVKVSLRDLSRDGWIHGDVIVNETLPAPERERRRGQLVLSGASGEWVYLRGDRQDPNHFLSFVVADA